MTRLDFRVEPYHPKITRGQIARGAFAFVLCVAAWSGAWFITP